jgi:dihydroxyacetone kinase-like predicted kinase
MGASGNSGVILSQILRGIAKGLEMKTRFTCIHFAQALSTASEMAHRAVTNPVEGTIITVSREASEMAMRMAERGASMEQTMSAIVTQAKKTVQKTPDLLPPLKEAGVVDAGGKGLFYVFQGMNAYISKRVSRVKESKGSVAAPVSEIPTEGYGFDVQFLIQGESLSVADIRAKIETMGESVIVVGDEQLIRVHIHTPAPDDVLDYARSVGEITNIATQNMDKQVEDFRKKYNITA